MAKLILAAAIVLLPTALFAAWIIIGNRRRQAADRGEAPRWWDQMPWATVTVMGAILLGAALAYWALNEEAASVLQGSGAG